MPRIPKHTRQVGVEKATQPLANAQWFTGPYRAMAGLGRAIGDIGDVVRGLEAQKQRTQLREFDAEHTAMLNRVALKHDDEYRRTEYGTGPIMEMTTDPLTGEVTFRDTGRAKKPIDRYAQDVYGEGLKESEALIAKYLANVPESVRKLAKAQAQSQLLRLQLRANTDQVGMSQAAAEAAIYKQADLLVMQNRDPKDIIKDLDALESSGIASADLLDNLTTQNRFDELRASVVRIDKERQEAEKDADVRQFVLAFKDDPQKGMDLAAINPDFDGDQAKDATTQLKLIKASNNEQLAEAQRQTGIDALNIISSGELPEGFGTFDEWLRRSPLDPTGENGRARYRSLWRQEADRRFKGEDSILNQSDPAVELDIQRRIAQDPESIDVIKDIYGPVGKGPHGGLSITKAAYYEDRRNKALKPDSQAKRPSVKRAEQAIDEILDYNVSLLKTAQKEGAATQKDVQKAIVEHVGIKQDFQDWLEIEKRTPEEILKQVDILTEPIEEEIKQGLFSKLMAGTWRTLTAPGRPGWVFGGRFRTKKKPTKTKKADPLGIR